MRQKGRSVHVQATGLQRRGTGLARGKGTGGRKGANMTKNCIDRVLQVLKVAEISLMGEDGCLGMDASETTTGLGGTAVGLELGTAQVHQRTHLPRFSM